MTSDKMNKTRRVVVERLVPHPKYGKMLRRRTICHAHDETNASHTGDRVEIMETRPLSKLKRWRIVRIVRPGASRPWGVRTSAAAAVREGQDGQPRLAPVGPDAIHPREQSIRTKPPATRCQSVFSSH